MAGKTSIAGVLKRPVFWGYTGLFLMVRHTAIDPVSRVRVRLSMKRWGFAFITRTIEESVAGSLLSP